MKNLEKLIRYIILNYPNSNELSKPRLVKLIYLIDWKFTIENGSQFTDIRWIYNHYGPYVNDVINLMKEKKAIFNVESYQNSYEGITDKFTLFSLLYRMLWRLQSNPRLMEDKADADVRAMEDLIRQGKVRYWGLSNYRGWRIAEVIRIADKLGVDRPVISQPLYNIVNRQAETEQITAAQSYGLGVVPYSPLARGVLSGKYAPDAKPDANSRAGRQDKRILETEWRVESLRIAQQIQQYTQGRGVGIVEFAIAWVLNNSAVTSAIVGPRTEQQWDAYTKAQAVKITAEDEAFIDSLVTPGHASTPGFNDVGHFVSGRKPR